MIRRLRAVRLRTRLVAYLAIVHLALAGMAVALALPQPRLLFALEALLVLSLLLGYRLVSALTVPLDLVRTGAELVAERDFSTTFRPVGIPELDRLVSVYNRMVAVMREERRALEERQLFLARVLERSPTGLVTLDLEGRIDFLNPAAAALLGGDVVSARGGRPSEVGGTLGCAIDALAVGSSAVLPFEGVRRVRATRGEFVDRGFARPFFLLVELTAELHASERAAYGQLVRLVAHEVNNSVGAVGSLVASCEHYAAHLGGEDRQDFESALAIAKARLESLAAFVGGFAEVVRLPDPERRPTDLKQLLDELLVLLGPELARRRIDVCWERAEPVSPLSMDKNQMERVLVNVLRNAAEAIGEDGVLTLSLGLGEGETAALAIRDSGPGVTAEILPKLFTPFFSTKCNGRGLGLTLVREVLERHGFAFGLASGEGQGATVWIRIPSSSRA